MVLADINNNQRKTPLMNIPTDQAANEDQKVLTLYERITISDPPLLTLSSHVNLRQLLDTGLISRVNLIRCIVNVSLGSDWLSNANTCQGWEHRIDCDTLWMGSTTTCILCQASGLPWGAALDKFRFNLDMAVDYGFHPGGPPALTEPTCKVLLIIWLTQIKMLRQGPGVKQYHLH